MIANVPNSSDQNALRIALAENKSIIDALNNSTIVSIADLKGRIVKVNDIFCAISGYSEQELLGQDHKILNSGFHPRQFWVEMWKTITQGKTWRAEVKNRAKDGSYYWVDTVINPMYDENGKIYQFLSIRYLITERKNAEMQVIAAKEQAEQANRTKDKFFSIIAHDLKTPFSGFIGLSEILFNEHEDLTAEDIQELGQSLNDSAKRVYLLLENLLDWSRSQMNIITTNKENLSIYYIAESVISLFIPIATKKKIEINNLIDKSIYAYADVNMVKTILRNLVSNAVKFTQENGKIVLESQISDEYVEILVIDSGIGISEDILSKLFHLDQKVSQLGTHNEQGTGLGLILSKEFIEKNHGNFFVKSTLGQGTTFGFSLPLVTI